MDQMNHDPFEKKRRDWKMWQVNLPDQSNKHVLV